MELYKELYFQMVRASEKALREMERQNFGAAKSVLIAAQREAEERFLNETAPRT